MKSNTTESIHSNIIDRRATLLSASTNRIVPTVGAAEGIWTMNGFALHRHRRTGTDRQRLVALLDEAIYMSCEIAFADDTPAQSPNPRDSHCE
jgi:hypothetical protein